MISKALARLSYRVIFPALLASGMLLGNPADSKRRFYGDDPVWQETDTQDALRVQAWEPDLIYDLVENLFAKPGDKDFNRRAQNLNSIDEVPNGAWFSNRIGAMPMSVDDVARGQSSGTGPAPGKWAVVSAKSDGVTPGFTIKDPAGATWYIKFDPPGYPGMATGTEVVVTRLFWALGYHVPHTAISKLRVEDLVIDPSATIRPPGSGKNRPLKQGDIRWLLKQASRDRDGSYRVIASLALPGKFAGRIRFYGTRPDDPNDVVPHENRRELRAYGTFAAWVNHVDAKSTNSIEQLITEQGRTFVRHYLLDFGSTLGSAAIGPREHWEGDEYIVQRGDIGKGMFAFGFYILPWRTKRVFESPFVGRLNYDNTGWDPESWCSRVPNQAFIRARIDDKFWAARRLMALRDDMIRATLRAGEFGDASAEEFLARVLIERRNAIGRKYLPAINPIVDPSLSREGELTFGNAAVAAAVASPPKGYTAVWHEFDNSTGTARLIGETSGRQSPMPAHASLPSAEGSYVQVDLSAVGGPNASWERPVHAWFRREGGSWKLVGFERLP